LVSLARHGRSHPLPTAVVLLVVMLLVWLCSISFATTPATVSSPTQVLQHAVLQSLAGTREVELPHLLSPADHLPEGGLVR